MWVRLPPPALVLSSGRSGRRAYKSHTGARYLRRESRLVIVDPMERRVIERAVSAKAIVIRPFRADDLDSLFDATERALGAEWLARHERGDLYVGVAEVGGVPVGRRCLELTSSAGEGAAYAFAGAVRPEWRSRGLGSMLDDHLEEVALARGFRALRCSVAKHNTASKAWHDRLGYRCIGVSVGWLTDSSGREVVADCWELERPLASSGRPRLWLRKRRRRRLRLRGMPVSQLPAAQSSGFPRRTEGFSREPPGGVTGRRVETARQQP